MKHHEERTPPKEPSKAENIKDGLEACIRGKLIEGNRSQRVGEKVARHVGRATGAKYETKPGIKLAPSPEKRIARKMIPTGSRFGRGHGIKKTEDKPMSDHKQRLIKAAKFLKDNYDKNGQELTILVKSFPYKRELHNIVDHMIATALGGWHKEGNQLVNETGHIANPNNWVLSEHGTIRSKDGKRIESIDNLLVIRGLTDEQETTTTA